MREDKGKREIIKDKVVELIWKIIEPWVDAHVTDRLVTFYRSLVHRGQLNRLPVESVPESSSRDYSQDHIYQ